MSLIVLLILLSFATISQCSDVCLCCDKQVVDQNLTDCRDIAKPATQEESNFLLEFCNKQNKSSYGSTVYYRIATIQQFDPKSVHYITLPTRDCNEIFHSMDGLLYLVPEKGSALFKNPYGSEVCYAALQKDSRWYGKGVPGVVCSSGYRDERSSTFRPFEKGHQIETSNAITYIYFLRQPVSYKITNASYHGNAASYYGRFRDNIDLGKFSTCNKHDMDVNSTISIKYKTETTLQFMPFSRIYDHLMKNGYSIFPNHITFELTDVENNTRTVVFTRFDQDIHYTTNRTYSIPLKEVIRPYECVSVIAMGSLETLVKKAEVTFEINLGSIGSFKDHVEVKKLLTVREKSMTGAILGKAQLFGYFDYDDPVIIIPYTTAALFLGCVLGMVIFGLVLLIVIKCGSYCDKRDFKKDWERTSERLNDGWVIVSTVTQEKAGILAHRLVRLGDYICNVGTWIYQEIDTSLTTYQDTVNRSGMQNVENNPRE